MKYLLSLFTFSLLTTPLCAEEVPLPPSPGGDFTQTLVMIGIALVFFYFILWRPEQKKRKELETKREQMKKGDRVQAMGILGKIHQMNEQTVILEMCDGSKMEVIKGAIHEVLETK